MSPVTFAPAAFPKGLIRLCAALCAAVLAVSLLPQLAQAEAAAAPRITPPQGASAVKVNDWVTVSGTAPAGEIQGGEWIAQDAEGNQLDSVNIPSSAPNAVGVVGVTQNQFISSSDGELTGQLVVPSIFADPDQEQPGVNPCIDPCVRRALLRLYIGGEAYPTNVLRVDFTRPTIERYDLVAPDQIRVVFSEPVALSNQGLELGTDWKVSEPSGVVSSVAGATEGDCKHSSNLDPSAGTTGCTRTLKLAQPMGEDDTPTVEYTNTSSAVPDRIPYIDGARNRAIRVLGAPYAKVAADLVRPAAPNLVTVAEQQPSKDGEVIGDTESPSVVVNNLTGGHQLLLSATLGGAVVDSVEQTVATNSTVAALNLPGDGDYLITAVAVDAAGNRSDELDKRGPRADGRAAVRYLRDGTVPEIIAANRPDSRTVDVTFSEAVLPGGNAGTWAVNDVLVDKVTGTGAARQLTLSSDINGPATLSWAPTPDGYKDRADNAVLPVTNYTLKNLPAVSAPTITAPTNTTYIDGDSIKVAGTTTDAETATTLQAQLFELNAEQPLATGSVQPDGSWEIPVTLGSDKRYEFEVRLLDTSTGVWSPRVRVEDIVRDTSTPAVEVSAPSGAALPGGEPKHYSVGDKVTVTWVATDAAANDTRQPDHGSAVDVIVESDIGARRIATALPYAAGKEQTFTYTLTSDDLAGRGLKDLSFSVVVTDLAGNTGDDQSGVIRLLSSRVGYTPVLIAPGVIEVRFSQQLQGAMLPNDWRVAGDVVAADQPITRDGRTIVVLRMPANNDPNASPNVTFVPALPATSRLRSDNDAQVTESPQRVVDRIIPGLKVTVPQTAAVIDRNSVVFTGETDKTSSVNTIRAYRADAAGNPIGSAIKSVKSQPDGTWTLAAPLAQNARNRIVLRATDPSRNTSATLPSSPYTVVEDSTAPVVSHVRPATRSTVGPTTRIRWRTVERHKKAVALSYRPNGGSWATITRATPDDGSFRWSVPMTLQGTRFALRVISIDRTGKTDRATVSRLRLDAVRPRLRAARTVADDKVRLYFTEPVRRTRRGDFEVDGRSVRRIRGTGRTRTLVLSSTMRRTTPTVAYTGGPVADRVGNQLRRTELTAIRGFVFSVTNVDVDRVSRRQARLSWTDIRNRASHVRGYRIYRDGERIATTGWATRSIVDRNARGSHRYTIRALDTSGRTSEARKVTLR